MRPLLIILFLISSLFAGDMYITYNNINIGLVPSQGNSSIVVGGVMSFDSYSAKGVSISMFNYDLLVGAYFNLINPNKFMFLESSRPAEYQMGNSTTTNIGTDMNSISFGATISYKRVPLYLTVGYSITEYYDQWRQDVDYAMLGHTENIYYKDIILTRQGMEFGAGINVHIERFVFNVDCKYNFPSDAVKLGAGIGMSFGGGYVRGRN